MRRDLAAALWTESREPPDEYVIYRLCQLWHCPPDVARRQAAWDAYAHLVCQDFEAKIAASRSGKRG